MQRIICQVIDYGGSTGGSFIPALESLSKATIARGERFVVCATKIEGSTWPAELVRAGAEVHLINGAAELNEKLRAIRPSIIHAHFKRYDLPILQSAGRSRVFWHAHSHREDLSVSARAKALVKYRFLGRRVERLVAVSQTFAEECIAFYAPRRWVSVVQNGIDTVRFRPAVASERSEARQLFGIGDKDRVVLFFERVPYKGGATLHQALKQLPDLRLLVVGGTKVDRERFADLQRVISIDRVADTRQLYWAADVLAFASDNEAFGFVLAEALATGLPVAATDIPIVHEVCGDVDQLMLFPVGDANALAEILPQAMNRHGFSGRQRMTARFDIERWTQDMLKLYD